MWCICFKGDIFCDELKKKAQERQKKMIYLLHTIQNDVLVVLRRHGYYPITIYSDGCNQYK